MNLLAQLWQQLRGVAQAGLEMLPARGKRSKQKQKIGAEASILDWLGLRQLAPRERILYYYLNILKRAENKGPARKEHQTPYEYEPNLNDVVPEVTPEIHELTDVFVYARYSQTDFNEDQAALVKAMWHRIRKALRNKNN